jgi:hypothetical protein
LVALAVAQVQHSIAQERRLCVCRFVRRLGSWRCRCWRSESDARLGGGPAGFDVEAFRFFRLGLGLELRLRLGLGLELRLRLGLGLGGGLL